MSSVKKKIIWAVDITQKPKEVKNIVTELKQWSQKTNCEVLPVAVFPKAILDIPLSLLEKRKSHLTHSATNEVTQFLKSANANSFLNPEVLLCSSPSNRSMAMTLLDYAESQKAFAIFANSHTKNLWNTFTIGGFAFTLTSLSHIPVLLMNLKAKPSKEIKNIIFPTDFSQDSKAALNHLKPVAKFFRSNVVLFNQMEYYNYLPLSREKLKKEYTKEHFKKMRSERTHEANAWVEKLSASGIKAEAIMKPEKKSLWSEIDSLAKRKKAGLVALSSTGGPVTQTILGSVTRNLVANAKYPVLVFHEPYPVSNKNVSARYKKPAPSYRPSVLHI